jgi:hypothetical protein
VRNQGHGSGKKKQALDYITEGFEIERFAQKERSQDQGRETDCDCRDPDFGVGAQEEGLSGILDCSKKRSAVTEVTCRNGKSEVARENGSR